VLEPAKTAKTSTTTTFPRLAGAASASQSALPQTSPQISIDELLWRMQGGDRDAAARFLFTYGSRIRRRIRGKLGPAIRKLFDSMDILSTLGRRLDLYVMSGRLQVTNEAQLWSLLFKMADHALIDKARIFNNLQTVEGEDSEFAHDFARRLRHADQQHDSGVELEIDNCLRHLDDPIDRRVLSMWLVGESYSEIARFLEMEPAAIRKRWERIKVNLREKFAGAS
jgi:DNA-directed RNA polymerase specialized sigma24 family protein